MIGIAQRPEAHRVLLFLLLAQLIELLVRRRNRRCEVYRADLGRARKISQRLPEQGTVKGLRHNRRIADIERLDHSDRRRASIAAD